MIDRHKVQLAFRATEKTHGKLKELQEQLQQSFPTDTINMSDVFRHVIDDAWERTQSLLKEETAIKESVKQFEETVLKARPTKKTAPKKPKPKPKAKPKPPDTLANGQP